MVREEIKGSTQTLEWNYVESRVDSNRLYYGHFIWSPLRKGQAKFCRYCLAKSFNGEIEGTCITRDKFGNVPHKPIDSLF
jgi:DNA-directed RNA polymerase subunit alpha